MPKLAKQSIVMGCSLTFLLVLAGCWKFISVLSDDCMDEQSVDADELFSAASNGETATVVLLIKVRVDVNSELDEMTPGKPQGHQSPLAEAVYNGHADIARILLAAGANPYHKNAQGLTAFDLAKQSKNPQLIELLKHYRVRKFDNR